MTAPSEEQLKADLQAMVDDMPIAVVFGAETVNCSKSVIAETEVAAAGGALTGYKMSLHCVASKWTTAPGVGDVVTVASVEYRVLRVNTDIVGMRLDVGEKYTEQAT